MVEAVLTMGTVLSHGGGGFAAVMGAQEDPGGGEKHEGGAEAEQGMGGIAVVRRSGVSGVGKNQGGKGEESEF
jgi:hypothetical protein